MNKKPFVPPPAGTIRGPWVCGKGTRHDGGIQYAIHDNDGCWRYTIEDNTPEGRDLALKRAQEISKEIIGKV